METAVTAYMQIGVIRTSMAGCIAREAMAAITILRIGMDAFTIGEGSQGPWSCINKCN